MVTVRNSTASANDIGFTSLSASSAPAEMNIESCVSSNNMSAGIQAFSGSSGVATIRVSNSTVTDNSVGIQNQSITSLILLRGNNTVEGNTTNTSGTIGSYNAK